MGRREASEKEWLSTGKGKGNASQNKVCSSNRKCEHQTCNRLLQGLGQNGSVDEDHCIQPKCCLAQGEKSR